MRLSPLLSTSQPPCPPLLASWPSPALLFMALSWAPRTLWCAQNAVRSHCSLTPPTRLSSTAGAGSPNVTVWPIPQISDAKPNCLVDPSIREYCIIVCSCVGESAVSGLWAKAALTQVCDVTPQGLAWHLAWSLSVSCMEAQTNASSIGFKLDRQLNQRIRFSWMETQLMSQTTP